MHKPIYRITRWRYDHEGTTVVHKTKSLNEADEYIYSQSGGSEHFWIEKYIHGKYICNVKSYHEYENDYE
jgi:hypothetical protein